MKPIDPKNPRGAGRKPLHRIMTRLDLDPAVKQALADWAQTHGVNRTAAANQLLAVALNINTGDKTMLTLTQLNKKIQSILEDQGSEYESERDEVTLADSSQRKQHLFEIAGHHAIRSNQKLYVFRGNVFETQDDLINAIGG